MEYYTREAYNIAIGPNMHTSSTVPCNTHVLYPRDVQHFGNTGLHEASKSAREQHAFLKLRNI